MATLVPVVAELGDRTRIDLVEAALRPVAGRVVVVGFGVATQGAVDHHLGLLAAARGARDEARAHWLAARALHRKLGAPALEAESARAATRR